MIEYPKIPADLDLRRKLSAEDKVYIFNRYKDGGVSQRQLAKEYGVSRRTITFIVDPKKLEANQQRRRERIARGERQETPEQRRLYMQKHRARKRALHPEYREWELASNKIYNSKRKYVKSVDKL